MHRNTKITKCKSRDNVLYVPLCLCENIAFVGGNGYSFKEICLGR